MNIMIVAGGTGGHIFPALAVAKALRDRGHTIFWLGTPYGMEGKLVPQHGFSLEMVPMKNLRGKGWKRYLLLPFRLLRAVLLARRIMKQRKIDLVLGFGGYVAGPGGLAAKCLRLPLIIHEQNAIPGMTNRALSKIANRILMGFPASFKGLDKAIYTGNPVRADLLPLANEIYQPHQPLHVLVIGGSLGAEALNQTVPAALAQMDPALRPILRHQTGEKLFDSVQLGLDPRLRGNDNITFVPFIDDMNEAYQWADLVICRAGALSVAELAIVGKPAIFIPYPSAVDDHQRKNAEYPTHEGASILILQKELTPEILAEQLTCLCKNPDVLNIMANKMKALGKPDATAQVVDVCEQTMTQIR